MRRTITKGSYVEVVDANNRYDESKEIAKKLGADDAKLNKATPLVKKQGDVLGIEEGFVLVDFGDSQSLMDIEAIKEIKRLDEIKYIVRFMHNNSIEEHSSVEEITKRMSELVKSGSMRIDQEVMVYQITSAKKLRMKIDIFLE